MAKLIWIRHYLFSDESVQIINIPWQEKKSQENCDCVSSNWIPPAQREKSTERKMDCMQTAQLMHSAEIFVPFLTRSTRGRIYY